MPKRSDTGKRSIFWDIFLTHYVLSSFLGLIFIEILYHLLTPVHHEAKHFSIDTIIAGAILNGFILALFIWVFHWLRDRWQFKHNATPWSDTPWKRRLVASGIAFGCGGLDVLFFLVSWAFLALTLSILIMVILLLRRFLRQVILLLRPGQFASWADVGELVHLYATMLAAFTLITVSLTLLPIFFKGYPEPFSIPADSASIIDAFYFCVVMMTTLGFGDIVPQTLSAKIVVSLQCMISYVMFGLMIGTITRGVISQRRIESKADPQNRAVNSSDTDPHPE
ncbi:MAG: potassium channel family protein [Deltaproteobacteria bacterium]|nr:potassium channel family protein [Deltaproteobacteria bacterium]